MRAVLREVVFALQCDDKREGCHGTMLSVNSKYCATKGQEVVDTRLQDRLFVV